MTLVKHSSLFSNLIVKEIATLTWTIRGFAQVEEVQSKPFAPLNSGHEFKLEFNATNHLFNANRLLVELWYNEYEKDVPLCYRISILDSMGKKHYTKEYFWKYQDKQVDYFCNFNITSYLSREQCDKLLVNGNLKIYCEVDILAEKLLSQQIESFGNLSKNYEAFLEGERLTDFIVQIGKKELRVHKAIMAAQSEVFAVMLEHDDTEEVKQGRVVIEDVAADVFELVIRYIYTGKVEGLNEHAAELFVAADKYQLDNLKSICEQSLISTIETESVSAVLLISDMHSAVQLKSKCIEFIVDNWNEVKKTKCWKEEIKGKRADLIEQILDFRY